MKIIADQFAAILAAEGAKRDDGVAMADSAGIRGIRMKGPVLVDDGVAAAFAHAEPFFIDGSQTALNLPCHFRSPSRRRSGSRSTLRKQS